MEIMTKKQFMRHKQKYIALIKKGAVFIHATDTIYGLACNALSDSAVLRIRKLKKRHATPFSVIAPSKDWIRKNCMISSEAEKWLKKLPGKYTLILKLRNKKAVSKNVNLGLGTIGIRIPKHWASGLSGKLKIPVVTTSANITGNVFMTSITNLDKNIKNKVDFIIYEGKKASRPSRIVDLTREKAKINVR